MHRSTSIKEKKSLVIKIMFFMVLLSFIGLMYFESGLLKDAIYFAIVLIIFIKFLIIKLYH